MRTDPAREPIFKENKPGILTKVFSIGLFFVLALKSVMNVSTGNHIRPWGYIVVLIGFVIFAVSKYSAIKKVHISFGTKSMTGNMANLYRLGYWLMVLGFLIVYV